MISMPLTHMRCPSAQLYTDASPSLLMPYFFFFFGIFSCVACSVVVQLTFSPTFVEFSCDVTNFLFVLCC